MPVKLRPIWGGHPSLPSLAPICHERSCRVSALGSETQSVMMKLPSAPISSWSDTSAYSPPSPTPNKDHSRKGLLFVAWWTWAFVSHLAREPSFSSICSSHLRMAPMLQALGPSKKDLSFHLVHPCMPRRGLVGLHSSASRFEHRLQSKIPAHIRMLHEGLFQISSWDSSAQLYYIIYIILYYTLLYYMYIILPYYI